MNIQEATAELVQRLGTPQWLQAIGRGKDFIAVYLKGTYKPANAPKTCGGWPIVYRENGALSVDITKI